MNNRNLLVVHPEQSIADALQLFQNQSSTNNKLVLEAKQAFSHGKLKDIPALREKLFDAINVFEHTSSALRHGKPSFITGDISQGRKNFLFSVLKKHDNAVQQIIESYDQLKKT